MLHFTLKSVTYLELIIVLGVRVSLRLFIYLLCGCSIAAALFVFFSPFKKFFHLFLLVGG